MYKGPHCSVLGFIIAHSLSNASVVKSEKGKKLYGKMSRHNSLALQVFGDPPVNNHRLHHNPALPQEYQ